MQGLSAIQNLYSLRYRGRLVCDGPVYIRGRLVIADGTRVRLGRHVRIRGLVRISGGGTVTVGCNTLLNGCWVVAVKSVSIGDDCLVSDCGITDSDYHNLEPELRHADPGEASTRPVVVDRNVWVGAQAMVLKGSHIGRDSVIGAGSIVRGGVPERVVVVGNPAKVVKHL